MVLMAYGSPERLEDVSAYYADIRGGRPIAPEQLENLVNRYRQLGIEESNPLNTITEQMRRRLAEAVALPVFTGMKHWTPRIADAAAGVLESGADTVVGLVLAPHSSQLTTPGYRDQLERSLDGRARLAFVESWHDDPGLVEFLAARVRGARAHLVFTAHSLPARIVAQGDTYRDQLLETSRLVAAAAAIDDWSFSFQSASATGEPWLGPDILDHLVTLHEAGTDDVLVCPVGFVSDHLEIRWDIDIEAQQQARELGMRFERTVMPNADPRFIGVLAGIVRRVIAGTGARPETRAGADSGPGRVALPTTRALAGSEARGQG